MQTAGGSGGISSVQVKGPNTAWTGLHNLYGAEWELNTQPQLPLDIHIIADTGAEVSSDAYNCCHSMHHLYCRSIAKASVQSTAPVLRSQEDCQVPARLHCCPACLGQQGQHCPMFAACLLLSCNLYALSRICYEWHSVKTATLAAV